MAYEAKTNWKLDDTVMPDDMNRIEQGIKDVESELENVNGIIILEASTDNVIDFNTLTEPGVYLIKNCGTNTTQNSGITTANYYYDIFLRVQISNTTICQTKATASTAYKDDYRTRTTSGTWSSWSTKKISYVDISTITSTSAGVRKIQASTTDLTAGTSSLTSGTVYLVYE